MTTVEQEIPVQLVTAEEALLANKVGELEQTYGELLALRDRLLAQGLSTDEADAQLGILATSLGDFAKRAAGGLAVATLSSSLAMLPAAAETHNNDGTITVEANDTLSGIAADLHVSLPDLIEVNQGVENPDLIHPGDVLYNPADNGTTSYTVRPGDNLTAIAERHGMTLDELLAMNSQFARRPNLIHPGDVVALGAVLSDADIENYTVLRGDNLSVIAERHGMTLPELLEMNPDYRSHSNLIYPGEVLILRSMAASDVITPSAPAPEVVPAASTASEADAQRGDYSVEEFMAAIAGQESSGNSEAYNATTQAYGFFQILPSNWPSWSREALGEVREQTPENQVLVARFKMQQYYEAFGHDWAAVAVAWFSGPSRGAAYARGERYMMDYSDGLSTVQEYVDHMLANIDEVDPATALPILAEVPPADDTTLELDTPPTPETDATAVTETASTSWSHYIDEGSRRSEANGFDSIEVNGIRVHVDIAPQVAQMLEAAAADGLNLTGGGFRTREQQIELRRQNCGTSDYAVYEMSPSQCTPDTARPGESNHERGYAIDFDDCNTHETACYQWLRDNAARFGFDNYDPEPWHWSTNGH